MTGSHEHQRRAGLVNRRSASLCRPSVWASIRVLDRKDTILNFGGVPMEEVKSIKCLGSSITATGQADDEISGKIGLARISVARL